MDRLTAMEAFVHVAEAGSFTAAARRSGRSKAMLSKQVANLEGHLGVELLRRTTRALSLTEAGRAYLARCVGVLEELQDAETALRNDHQGLCGALRVTAPPGFVSRYGDAMTVEFLALHPRVKLHLDLTHRLVDLVEEGVDVAIRITKPDDSTLVARKLAPAPVLAVASPDYLARRGTPRRPADLSKHDCLIDTNFRGGDKWRLRGPRGVQSVRVDGPVRANSPNLVCDLAERGLGVALVPELVAAPALREGRLEQVLRGRVALDWSVYAVYPRRRHLSARARTFIEHMAAVVAGHTA